MKPIFQKLIFCGVFLLIASFIFIQQIRRFSDTSNKQAHTPSKQEIWRSSEGGGEPVAFDVGATLPELLQRLSNNWQFVETGKGYWIGYTDDMYSIAAHGEAAIAPLLKLAKNAPSQHTRVGAVYSLHLIGIESHEAGRYIEEFKVLAARQALRSLLTDTIVGVTAGELLMRDPWQSDVPLIFESLEKGGPNDWVLVNLLQRYALAGLPLQQAIPNNIGNEPLQIPPYQWKKGEVASRLQVHSILLELVKLRPRQIVLEKGVEQLRASTTTVFEEDMTLSGHGGLCVRDFLYEMTEVDYLRLGSQLFYFVEGQKVTVCGATTARKRALAWWQAQTPAYRQQFTSNQGGKLVLTERFLKQYGRPNRGSNP